MKKLQELKNRIEYIQTTSAVASEMKAFVALVLKIFQENRNEFDTLSAEQLLTIKEAVEYVNSASGKALDELNVLKDKFSEEAQKDVLEVQSQVQNAYLFLEEVKKIKIVHGKNGTNGKNGEDGYTPIKGEDYFTMSEIKELKDSILKDIPEIDAKEIKSKLESLQGEARLDASAIKNLPTGKGVAGSQARNLWQLQDVEIDSPTDGQSLVYDSDTQTWKNEFDESQGLLVFMLANVASDIATYYDAVSLQSYVASAEGSISTPGVSTTPTLLGSFATELGYPGVVNIPIGIFHVHYETEKVAGSNNYYSFAQIYKRSSGGTETLLLTTDNSTQTASNTRFQATVSAVSGDIIVLDPTDRIVVKVYGVMLSATANIGLYFDDATEARLEMPSVSVDASNFVPYTGATTDVNLGSNNLSVADEAYGVGWNGSLEVPTKNAVYDKIEAIISSITRVIVTTATSVTAGALAKTDYVYLVNGTGTITLPTAVGNTNRYTVKNTGSDDVTIACSNIGETIDGGATAVLTAGLQGSLDFISDGSNWFII